MKRLLSLFLLMYMSLSAMASGTSVKNSEGVEIWYDFDSSTKTAAVTKSGSGTYYSGNVVIPSTVIYEGVEYSVTSIGDDAFYDCSALTSITLPEGLTSIGDYVFLNCSSLTSITIPEGVTEIGKRPFQGCSGLTSVTIPEGVTSIGDYAFWNCSSLTSITIPEGVTEIGENAFSDCSSLTSVTIPESVTSIRKYVFSDCSSLTSITIPEGVTEIGENVFSDCSSLTSIDVASDNNNYTSIDGVLFSKDKTILIRYPEGKDVTSYALPEGVTKINSYAFFKCSSLTSITIPEGVTSIRESAFLGCSGLTSITIPDGVTSLGYSVFEGCSGLTSITLPNNLTSMGSWAFKNCKALTSITLPECLTSIVSNAFEGCSGLISVTIPESVTKIGEEAFSGCSGLTSVTIPEGVTSIGNSAFSGCRGLTSVTIPEGVTSIGSSVFYNCRGLTSVTMPDGVTSIGESAFEYCRGLTSVTIPDGVTSIGSSAFGYCSGLTSVTIPEGVTSIGANAFNYCKSLKLVINKSDLAITAGSSDNGYVAYYAAIVTDSDNNIKTVGDYVFHADGDTVMLIAYNGKEKTITLPSDYEGKSYSIADKVFYDCDFFTSITIPEGVTSIGENAFYNCDSLISITLSEGLTSIGEDAFGECNAITDVNYNGTIADWCGIEFENYYSTPFRYADHFYIDSVEVKELIIPNGVTTINDYAFYGRDSLKSITIPESVTSIGDYAFIECSSLTSITIPKGVTSIGESAFWGCNNLRFVINKSDLYLREGYSGDGYVAYYADRVLKDGEVKFAGDYVFNVDGDTIMLIAYDGEDTSIILPSDYEGNSYSLANKAFYGCSSLTNVTIPEEVTSIGNNAFGYCNGLTSITIPEGVTEIGDYAFYGCENLKYVVNKSDLTITAGSRDNGDVAYYAIIVTDSEDNIKTVGDYLFYADGDTTMLIAYKGEETSITLPSDYEGKSYSIANKAFYNCSALTRITIPESVDTIGSEAFYDCFNLRLVINRSDLAITAGSRDNGYVACYATIVTDSDDNIKTVGDYQFYVDGDSTMLIAYKGEETSITLPSDYEGKSYSIANKAFYNCDSLTSVTIPEGVTSIGKEAFYYCSSLTSVTIPECVTEIGDYAFYRCSSLTSVTIPESVTEIGDYAFFNCSSLTSVTIPESVTSIGGGVFSSCSSLISVTIPESVTLIGGWTFGDCSSLTSITSKNTTPPTVYDSYTFYNVDRSIPVYVPKSSVEAYKSAEYWSEFTNIQAIDDTPISDIQTSDVNVRLIGNRVVVEGADDYTVYSINGQNLGKVESVERGIYIVVVNGKNYKVIAK